MSLTELQPTSNTARIPSLDLLRGFAVLGILIMNIQSYSLPTAAYSNPTVYGNFTGIHKWIWGFSYLVAHLKFMAVFSILFGAGIVLGTQKAESNMGNASGLFYRRMFWLLILGMMHAYFIWFGDILVSYAVLGMMLFPLRKLQSNKLFVMGIFMLSISTFSTSMLVDSLPYWSEADLERARITWNPDTHEIQREIEAFAGSLAQQFSINSAYAWIFQTQIFLFFSLWRSGGLMLVGMALYKWEILSAKKSIGFYRKGLLISFVPGLLLIIYGIMRNEQVGWTFEFSFFWGKEFNYWGSLGVAFGYICMIMLLCQSGKLYGLQKRLEAVGKMALTNYATQSILCTGLFYGYGLGLFGQFDRIEQIWVVFVVAGLQLIWSKFWLNHFRFGPLEWLWRSLTYQKLQPFKIVK